MDGRMMNEWVLECSGRVLGAKSGKAVDNLLRLHKKKCAICRKVEYLCLDDGARTIKKVSKIKKIRDDHNKRHAQLKEVVVKMESIV